MKKGFTIIEIMVVIAIIAILSTIIYANVNEGRKKARDAIRIHDIQTIAKSIDSYFVENNNFPPSFSAALSSAINNTNPTWDQFSSLIGLNPPLHDPREKELFNDSSAWATGNCANGTFNPNANPGNPIFNSLPSACIFAAHNYLILWPDAVLNKNVEYPILYTQLEGAHTECNNPSDDNDPPGCSPRCLDGLGVPAILGPIGIVNCTDLKRGCVMGDANIFGGSNAWACIPLGPNAP
jgi:general secretion pathway protein G